MKRLLLLIAVFYLASSRDYCFNYNDDGKWNQGICRNHPYCPEGTTWTGMTADGGGWMNCTCHGGLHLQYFPDDKECREPECHDGMVWRVDHLMGCACPVN
jgi:hypothetical protein